MSKEEGKNLCLLLTYTNTLLFPNNHVVYSREGGKLSYRTEQNIQQGNIKILGKDKTQQFLGIFFSWYFFLCRSFSSFCVPTRTPCVLICLGLSSVVLLGSWLLFTLKYLNLFSENCAEVWQWWSFREKILQLPVLNTVQQAIYWLLSAKGSL